MSPVIFLNSYVDTIPKSEDVAPEPPEAQDAGLGIPAENTRRLPMPTGQRLLHEAWDYTLYRQTTNACLAGLQTTRMTTSYV